MKHLFAEAQYTHTGDALTCPFVNGRFGQGLLLTSSEKKLDQKPKFKVVIKHSSGV